MDAFLLVQKLFLAFFQADADQLCQLKNIVGPKDQIHIAVALSDLFYHFLFLHHTAAERDHHMGMLFLSCSKLS